MTDAKQPGPDSPASAQPTVRNFLAVVLALAAPCFMFFSVTGLGLPAPPNLSIRIVSPAWSGIKKEARRP